MAINDSTLPEEWRPVVEWEGFYEVSNAGRLRSVDRTIIGHDGVPQRFRGRELRLRVKEHGYLTAHLRDTSANRRKIAMVHRLVAMAFIPAVDGKPNVNHLDCDPSNNRVSNLEWCTQRENLAHMTALGRRSKHQTGKRSPNAHLDDGDVRQMRQMHATGRYSWEKLACLFGLSKRAAGRIVKGETYADVR